jgi:hypothetical protein
MRWNVCPRITRINANDFLFLRFFRVYSRDSRAMSFFRRSPAAPKLGEGGRADIWRLTPHILVNALWTTRSTSNFESFREAALPSIGAIRG